MIPVLFGILGGVACYKFAQAALDEEYPSTTVPADVRETLINEHIRKHGYKCLECERRVPRSDFEVDHIVPIFKNGSNSRSNLQVICRDCNRQKGTKFSPLDWLRGREN